MIRIGWRFPPLSGGTKQGFNNNDVEAFRGEELMDNLAREICQNSLDAKPEGASGPVKVVFELKSVSAPAYPFSLSTRSASRGAVNTTRTTWVINLSNFSAMLMRC